MKALTTSSLLLSLLASPLIYAASPVEECRNNLKENATTEAISQCLDKATHVIDKEMQTWLNLHQFNLEEQALVQGRNSALNMFKRSQNNFTTYRENNCRWQYLAISPDISAGLAYKECYILLSQQRINELSRLADSTTVQ